MSTLIECRGRGVSGECDGPCDQTCRKSRDLRKDYLDSVHWPTTESSMVYCGNVQCATRSAPSFDPLLGERITGRRFYADDLPDGEVWLCPDCRD